MMPKSARRIVSRNLSQQPLRTNASLCQGSGWVFLVAFLAAEYCRRLAAPPGRSSSLRCGRSTWTCGFADGGMAAIEERPAVPGGPGGGSAVTAVGWGADPGVGFLWGPPLRTRTCGDSVGTRARRKRRLRNARGGRAMAGLPVPGNRAARPGRLTEPARPEIAVSRPQLVMTCASQRRGTPMPYIRWWLATAAATIAIR